MSAPLAKGQNGPLNVNEVNVSVRLSAPADLSALLVTDSGKVRSDADFVFFNQPSGPGVRLQPGQSGQPASLAVTLSAIPPDIAQIRAVITLDDPSSTFGQSAPPTAFISDSAGNPLYEYRIDGLAAESIVIAVEIYRRQDTWKVRAVGQGYAGGFAALVTDHGVSVDDAPAPSVVTPPAAAPPPPPAPSYPPPAAPVPPVAPSAPPAARPSGEVSLTKGRPVSLTKGQKVTLRKDGGVALGRVRMGLGWDPVKSGGFFGNRTPDIDLDASAVLFADDSVVDVCYYGQLKSKDGSVQHQGDNLTGEGEGDDEVIVVDLQRIPAHVTTVMFIVTSYRGHTFDQLSNAFCRLVDDTKNGGELARYTLAGAGLRTTGMVMAKFFRAAGDWKLQAIGEPIQAKHVGEAAPLLPRFVAS
ncbi:transport-associated protein [Mycobacterium antarcticum]|uniref:TerD family protein n=1 Tax=Mycolicibacterium sp. TUM20983 TaxID=3023369 RepID=UPI00238EC0BC|nr:TerD family protein [Mycolicibacterium sp. TUM20983]GLP72941.1 transport-associated protein [Mycolicibacterium sp. TUM20983]